MPYRYRNVSSFAISVTILLISVIFILSASHAWTDGFDLSVSTSVSGPLTVDLSSLAPPDSDNPYITIQFEIIVDGTVPSTVYVSLKSGEGLYLTGRMLKPRSSQPPFRAEATVKVGRHSELGDREITITASGGGMEAKTKVLLKLSRETVKISLTEPKADSYFSPGNVKIEGKIDPPLAGVVVHIDIYHRFPELKTPEQIGGWKSGIRQWGMTVTKADGSFSIDQKTIAFKHFILGGVPMDIGGGVWYIHFYTRGTKLFGDALKKVNYQKPVTTAYEGVKTFETDYTGVPATAGGDVPAKYVRKLIVSEPQIQLEIKGGNTLYPQQSIGRNVFRRGLDRPIFEITLTGATHELVASGIAEIRINLTRPGRDGVDTKPTRSSMIQAMNFFPLATLKPTMHSKQTIKPQGSTTEDYTEVKSIWIITWDWTGTYGGGITGNNKDEIPIGIYGVRAELWDIKGNRLLNSSEPKSSLVPQSDSFFVVYDFDSNDGFVTEQTCKEYSVYPHAGFTSWKYDTVYRLHQYNFDILTDSLKRISFYGGFPPASYNKVFHDAIQNPTTSILETTLVINNEINSPMSPQRLILTYDSSMDEGHYDTLVALRSRRGLCADYSGIMIAYLRAVGIPCRYVTGRAYNIKEKEVSPHAWVEVWDESTKIWHIFDPTNGLEARQAINTFAGVIGDGTYGQFYPEKGESLLGSYQGYWVVTESRPRTDHRVNIYVNYSYIASIENAKFDRAPGETLPGTYDAGDAVRFDCDIKNIGVLDLDATVSPRVNATLVYEKKGTLFWGSMSRQLPNMPMQLPAISAGNYQSITFSFNLPNEEIRSPKLRLEVWYPSRYQRTSTSPLEILPAIMVSRDFQLPFRGPSTPSIEIGGLENKLELPSRSETHFEGEYFTSYERYSFDPVSVRRTIRSHDSASISDRFDVHGSDTTTFTINWPLEGTGDTVTIHGLNPFTSDRHGLNIETNYVTVYSASAQSSSVYIFSPDIHISSVSITDIEGEKWYKVDASWVGSISQDCGTAFLTYYTTYQGTESAEQLCAKATQDAWNNGIHLLSVTTSAPVMVFPPTLESFDFTVRNDGCIEQNAVFNLEISKPLAYTNTTRHVLFQDSISLTIPAGATDTKTIPVEILANVSKLPWELSYSIEGGGAGKQHLFLSYPITSEIDRDLVLKPDTVNVINVTLTNIASFEIPWVTATIDILGTGRIADEFIDRSIGKFNPGESKTVTWSIEAFSTEYVSLQVSAISGERVVSEEIFHLPVAIPGLIDVEDLTIEAEPAGKRNPKSVGFTLVVRNLGNYPSTYSWVELMLPYGVSGSRRITIGQLAAGAETTISGTLAYNLSEDFIVIVDVADAQGLKSSASIYADMGKPPGSSGLGLYALSPVIFLLPVVEVALIFGSKRNRGRRSS